MKQKIIISEEQMAKLDWALSQIYEFMKETNLSELKSELLPVKCVDVSEK